MLFEAVDARQDFQKQSAVGPQGLPTPFASSLLPATGQCNAGRKHYIPHESELVQAEHFLLLWPPNTTKQSTTWAEMAIVV